MIPPKPIRKVRCAIYTRKPTPDDTLLKALARAHRWKRMLESGQVASLNELSETAQHLSV